MSTLGSAGRPNEDKYLTALLFGPSKTGKTTLAATAPKAIILDFEGGTKSVRKTDADVLYIPNWSTLDSAVLELMQGGHGYESVVVDSITFMQEVAGTEANLMDHIINPAKDARQAYGKVGAMVRHKLMLLHQLPMHTIFTAQLREREQEDVEAGKYPLVPEVTPAVLKIAMALPDLIARTAVVRKGATTKDVEYQVIFGPETRSQVGNRGFDLPYSATGVTIPKLIDKYKEN
jgi:hypothetical protein